MFRFKGTNNNFHKSNGIKKHYQGKGHHGDRKIYIGKLIESPFFSHD